MLLQADASPRARHPRGRTCLGVWYPLTLRQAFEPLAGWTRDPASFPYWDGPANQQLGVQYFSDFEILHAHWPNADAAARFPRS